METIKSVGDSILTYLAVALAWCVDTGTWTAIMGVGSFVLLVARLIVDGSKAIEAIKSWRKK